MTSESLRQLLWDQRCDADRTARYWLAMSSRLHRADRIVAVLSFLSASATVLALATSLFGPRAAVGLAAMAALTSAGSLWFRLSRALAVSTKMVAASSREHVDFELLWAEHSSLPDLEVKRRLEEIMGRYHELGMEAAASVPESRSLNLRCDREMRAAISA